VTGGALLARAGAVCVLLLAPWHPGPAPGAGALQAAGPRYWAAADLNVRPQIKTHVMPEYPPELLSGTRGRVVLDLYLSTTGTLDRIRVVKAEPPGRFEQSAFKAFSGARFTPGMRKGKPVATLLRIEVTYGD
jgi:protein TonB